MTTRKGPVMIAISDPAPILPQEAPLPPDAAALPEGRAMILAAQLAAKRPSFLARLFWRGAAGLITLNATADINGPDADGKLDLAAGSSVDASSETAGEIALRGLGAITLTDVDTVNGLISVMAAGAITATQVDAGGGAGDSVTLTTTTGDITVGSIGSADTVLLDTDSGSIIGRCSPPGSKR